MMAACKRVQLSQLAQLIRSASTASSSTAGSIVDDVIVHVRGQRNLGKHEEALDILKSGLATQGSKATGVSAGRCRTDLQAH